MNHRRRESTLVRNARRLLALLGVLAVAFAVDVDAQASLERADAAFAAQEWKRAAEIYDRHLDKRAETGDGTAWFRLGFARYQLGDDAAALDAFEQAETRGVATPRMFGSAAIAAHRLGQPDQAWTFLERAADAGLPPAVLSSNAQFERFRGDARYPAIYERARQVAFPCLGHQASRHFDFWVGEWDVESGGRVVGVNRITNRHEGCLIFEDYVTRPGGFAGQSFNFFDPGIDAWRQIWIDNGGRVTHYEGRFRKGAMRFAGEAVDRAGTRTTVRMTFTPNEDGSVRQLIEQQGADGAWSVSFDGSYLRRKAE